MHCTMGVVNVFNSFCWGMYAALIDYMFILGPNMMDFYLDHMRIKTKNGQLDLFWECNPQTPAKVVVFSPDEQPKSMSSSTEFVAEHLLR
ncbi:hypothetical protein JG688_00013323 [Phytophthora aleatoria]|uniref:Uncharacterized protein n=1 Tax=Phytophthora aleatoria TaxID=2496075 RepID=A0A8J5IMH4_9STRA|nr:hypothetical protein JG688_00013323 [Phytophthora aleatoria]